MEKIIIKCNLFVVPNMAMYVGRHTVESNGLVEQVIENQKEHFGTAFKEQPMIEVWGHNEQCDNFSDHWKSFEEISGGHRFPNRFPLYLLADGIEGETITIDLKNYTIEATLCQSEYKYSMLGSFEQAVDAVMQKRVTFDAQWKKDHE